jgi:hypothetical protein
MAALWFSFSSLKKQMMVMWPKLIAEMTVSSENKVCVIDAQFELLITLPTLED